jgi:hypothetical protein
MTCEEARKHLWRKPFQPVQIRLKDGRTFDIRYRGWTLAADAILIIVAFLLPAIDGVGR